MQGKKERWMELCDQAAVEQDLEKLAALVLEIDMLLGDKRRRLEKVLTDFPDGIKPV